MPTSGGLLAQVQPMGSGRYKGPRDVALQTMKQDPFFDLLTGYVLDEHPEDVRSDIEAHLNSGCKSCLAELRSLQEAIHSLPLVLPAYPLPAEAKMQIDREIDRELKEEPFLRRNVSHYLLKRRLGIGGMGEVFLAEDLKLGRSAAIKVIRPEVAENVERKKRFLREARAAAVLSHPGIATIYEVGQDQGTDFIAMEYVEGHR